MEKAKRNMGIEILRIIAMFQIVFSHILTQGGIINNAVVFSSQYYASWTLMILGYSAVNTFALISGFVGVEQSFKGYSKIIMLWLNVLFYTVLTTLCFSIFTEGKVGLTEWVKAFTPASTGQYWFFSSYFILFFLMPFFNKLLNSLDGKKRLILSIILVLLFSVLPTIRQTDAFVLNSGYSPLWLMVMYLIGGCVKKANLLRKIKLKWWIIILLLSIVLCVASKFGLEYFFYKLSGEVKGGGIFVSYISPLVILVAISSLAIFERINIKGKFFAKFIRLISGSAFSVYIIHEHPLTKHQFLIDAFLPYLELSAGLLVLRVLGAAIVIFASCILIDLIRVALFKLIKINKFANAVDSFAQKSVGKLCDSLNKKIEGQDNF